MHGGIRVGKRIREDLIYIRRTLEIAEYEVNTTKIKRRIGTAKKILDKYINPEVYYADAERVKNKS